MWSYGDRWSAALSVFAVALGMNALWALLFWQWHNPLFSLFMLLIVEMLSLIAIVMFYRRSRLAAALLLPYILWISYCLALNYTIWQLN
jgi:translocator protein